MGLSGVEETDPSGILARAAVTMYKLMIVLKEVGLTNHLPHALVRIHHLQKIMKGVEMKDIAHLIMASPELVKIMNVAHEDPEHMEEVRISNFRVPLDIETEISSIDDITARRDDPGTGVYSAVRGRRRLTPTSSKKWRRQWVCNHVQHMGWTMESQTQSVWPVSKR
eukprot:1974277-Amphidinium_carterae.1